LRRRLETVILIPAVLTTRMARQTRFGPFDRSPRGHHTAQRRSLFNDSEVEFFRSVQHAECGPHQKVFHWASSTVGHSEIWKSL